MVYCIGKQNRTLLLICDGFRYSIQPFLRYHADRSEPSGVRVNSMDMSMPYTMNGRNDRSDISQKLSPWTCRESRHSLGEGCNQKMI